MPIANTDTAYGGVTRSFHWLTVLLIATVIPLGIFANDLAETIRASESAPDAATLARVTLLFSLHKTLGVAIFFTAVLRILWALSQPKPGLLNGDRRAEAWLAETVHWLLYSALIIVPLAGWVHHAATTGFAPIWWPFGQDLPFVPKSETLAHTAASLHIIFERVLVIAIALHVAGALKHHFIDRDETLRRMTIGAESAPSVDQPGHLRPIITALALWAAAIGVGAGLGLFAQSETAAAPSLEKVTSDWTVQNGTLGLSITQLGGKVSGEFGDWTAQIAFDETATDQNGTVTVTINIASLTLGSVTAQSMGPDYFDATAHPTATFNADIFPADTGYIAKGTLTLKGIEMPLDLPFTLILEGNSATMSGTTTIKRLDHAIGASMPTGDDLGLTVDVNVALTATR